MSNAKENRNLALAAVPNKNILPEPREVARGIAAKLDLRGLSFKQKNFILAYCGDPVAAALEAGYGDLIEPAKQKSKLHAAVRSLMANPQVRTSIEVINAGMEFSGVVSSLELRVKLSDMVRDDDQDPAIRLRAMKLLSQCYSAFSEKIDIKEERTQNITVLVASAEPTNEQDRLEFERLEKAIEVQTDNELTAMNKKERRLIGRPVSIDDVL